MTTKMMQAVRFHRFGSPEELVVDSIPLPPNPGNGELLVRIHAAGVNPIDAAMRAGLMQNRLPITLPAIPGVELSGTVEEIGPDVISYVKGQAIYANNISKLGNGSNAEYMLLPANNASPMPGNLDFDQAASVAHGARTAWAGLFEFGDLQPGQRILIQGGAGGVGMYAVQLAHLKGAYVIATAGPDNIEFVSSLGAEEVINYKQVNFEEIVKNVDMVFDTVGGEVMERSWQTLKAGGMLVSAVGFPSEETAVKLGVRSARVMYSKDIPAILRQVTNLVENGTLKPHVRKIFPMAQVAEAHALCETRHGRGRIVIHIAD